MFSTEPSWAYPMPSEWAQDHGHFEGSLRQCRASGISLICVCLSGGRSHQNWGLLLPISGAIPQSSDPALVTTEPSRSLFKLPYFSHSILLLL